MSWFEEFAGGTPPPAAQPRVETLPALPSPGAMYAAALARASRAAVTGALTAQGEREGALPPVGLQVSDVHLDQDRLDRYRHLVGDRMSSGGEEQTPPGFVHVTVFGLQLALMTRADFPLPPLGLVHLSNRIEQLRAVPVGADLTATCWARDLAARPVGTDGVGTQVELVTEVRAGAELLWQGVSTYLARGTRVRGVPLLERPDRPEIELGAPTGGWSTSRRTTREYAAVSGDRNPIHTSSFAAKGFGFPRSIAHGMDTAARALAALGPVRGEAFSWEVDFAAPVLVPARVALRVAPGTDLDPTGVRHGWEMTVWDPRSRRVHLTSRLLLSPAGA